MGNESFKGLEETVNALQQKISEWDKTVKTLEQELHSDNMVGKAIADFRSVANEIVNAATKLCEHIAQIPADLVNIPQALQALARQIEGVKASLDTVSSGVSDNAQQTQHAASELEQLRHTVDERLTAIATEMESVVSQLTQSQQQQATADEHLTAVVAGIEASAHQVEELKASLEAISSVAREHTQQVQRIMDELEKLRQQQAIADERLATITGWVEEQKAPKRRGEPKEPPQPSPKKTKGDLWSRLNPFTRRKTS